MIFKEIDNMKDVEAICHYYELLPKKLTDSVSLNVL
jgi:hypothetical protein